MQRRLKKKPVRYFNLQLTSGSLWRYRGAWLHETPEITLVPLQYAGRVKPGTELFPVRRFPNVIEACAWLDTYFEQNPELAR